MHIVLTGANGFVGQSLLDSLLQAIDCITAALRRRVDNLDPRADQFVVEGQRIKTGKRFWLDSR